MIRPRNILHLGALAALVAASMSVFGCTVNIATSGCEVDGKSHAAGASFPAPDGCNTCTCNDDGSVGCTEIGCVGACTDASGSHEIGSSWAQGCNTCHCVPPGVIGCTTQACEEPCEWMGNWYPPGAEFPAGDGCNTCTCDGFGGVGCTLIACVTCSYDGKTYKPGESFPATDGCNTCTCDEFGNVGCTKTACTCDPENEWWHDYVGDSPATCQVIDFACPPKTTMFSNACGCGCEQDPSCPEYFDCQPPSPCDLDKIKAECPYSGIAL